MIAASMVASGFSQKPRRPVVIALLAILMSLGLASQSAAQGFISPFIGYDFGGDSGCAQISPCENKNLNWGVAFGSLGSVLGAELEIANATNFFGDSPTVSSNVLTVMGNAMLAPKFGPAQPYVLAGLGLLKTRVEFTAPALLETSNNHFGWDVGGGIIAFFSPHVGVRGDIRYFHAFQSLEFLSFLNSDEKLDFGRVSGGLVFKF